MPLRRHLDLSERERHREPHGDSPTLKSARVGRELWQIKLPAGGKPTPMTYLGADGRRSVVIAAGSDGKAWGKADSVLAFALPKAH